MVSRYLLKELLADTHFTIIEAATGQEGIRLAQEENPSGIFLDLLMPEINGFEVLDHLKSDPATSNIPVIVNFYT
jgi:CheY-like chemotaxis protein